ncbi:MAG: tetratricopeptide repeat protein [Tildeniella nuda ZEHNDER 1965/U140]|jgi:superkiller protein 3|nr:tetratricopeptide repeat protein [Tildeniella nuda ZEHNDER 1965/U140]
MTAKPTEDDIPLPPETSEEVYQYLSRSLRRKRGFGLFFVQCTPAQATDIIADLKEDLPQKKMQELRLDRDSTTLYDQVEALWQQQPFDILFVTNLEASVLAYEDTKRLSGWGDPEIIYTVSWKGVPPILSHLNQQRERFRDHFGCSFVFLVPPFVIKYFIQRAPDFFDWRSGLFTVPPDENDRQQESAKLLSDKWNDYTALSPEARTEKLLTFRDYIEHHQSFTVPPEAMTNLLCQQGLLFESDKQYAQALVSYEKALELQPANEKVWLNRGDALFRLGRYADAITSYDQAVAIKPDFHTAWKNRGDALLSLERHEDAIASYDRAVAIKPGLHEAWNSRGVALDGLGRYEDAITSYDCAVAIQPDNHKAWYNRGNALGKLRRDKDALASYDRAVAIKPDDHGAWCGRGIALFSLERAEESIDSYDRAVAIKPDYHEAWSNRGDALENLRRYEEAVASYDRAVAIQPNYYKGWIMRGAALVSLMRLEDAVASLDQALAINPELHLIQGIQKLRLDMEKALLTRKYKPPPEC